MTNTQFAELMAELRGIRAILERNEVAAWGEEPTPTQAAAVEAIKPVTPGAATKREARGKHRGGRL